MTAIVKAHSSHTPINHMSVPYGLTDIARFTLAINAYIATTADIRIPILRIGGFAETAAANDKSNAIT